MKNTITTIICILGNFYLVAQNSGDYRTKSTGAWATVANWETYNGSGWVNAVSVPSSSSGTININHNITVSSTQSVSTAIIASGVTLTVATGGNLNLGANAITGAGNFTLSAGGYIKIGHTAGLAASGASGNIQVTGTRTYDQGGYFEYSGSSAQSTGAGIPSQVAGLIINNADGVTINKNDTIVITDSLSLRNGKLLSSAIGKNYPVMENSSTIKGVYTSSSFIQGPIRLIYRSTTPKCFDLPLGHNAHIHRFETCMDHNNINPNIYEWEAKDPNFNLNNVTGGIHHVTNDFYWRQDPIYTSGSLTQQSIRGYWTAVDGVTNVSSLTVSRFDGSNWNKLTGSTTVTGTTAGGNVLGSNNSQSRSYYTLASVDTSNILPIAFLTFYATSISGKSALLTWKTASEWNNSHFTVFKSVNNQPATFLAEVRGMGNSNQINTYDFTDMDVQSGKTRYMLYQTDFDGTTEFLGLATLSAKDAKWVEVFPNPCADQLTVSVFSSQAGYVILTDAFGTVVKQQNHDEDGIYLTINATELANGVYYLQAVTPTETIIRKVILN